MKEKRAAPKQKDVNPKIAVDTLKEIILSQLFRPMQIKDTNHVNRATTSVTARAPPAMFFTTSLDTSLPPSRILTALLLCGTI